MRAFEVVTKPARYARLIVLSVVAIPVVDWMILAFPAVGGVGTALWLLAFVFLVVYAGGCFVALLRDFLRGRFPLTAVALTAIFAFILVAVLDREFLSGELVGQVACAMNRFTVSGIPPGSSTCFLGYPTRGYLVSALPSLIAGPSLPALKLGGCLMLLLGLVIFSRGMTRYFADNAQADLLCAVCLAMLPNVYFWAPQLRSADQALQPLSFALILAGLLFHYMRDRSDEAAALVGVVLLYAALSYPPVLTLAVLPFGAAALLARARAVPRRHGLFALLFLLAFAGEMAHSLLYREDLRIAVGARFDPWERVGELLHHVVFQDARYGIFSPVLQAIFFLTMAFALAGGLGLAGLATGLWILAVVFSSVLVRGYSFASVPFVMHRLGVIFPVFFALFALAVSSLRVPSRIVRRSLAVLLAALVAYGAYYQAGVVHRRPPSRSLAFVRWLHAKMPGSDRRPWLLQVDSDPGLDDYRAAGNVLAYFHPGSEVRSLEKECKPVPREGAESLLVVGSGTCRGMKQGPGLVSLGEFAVDARSYPVFRVVGP